MHAVPHPFAFAGSLGQTFVRLEVAEKGRETTMPPYILCIIKNSHHQSHSYTDSEPPHARPPTPPARIVLTTTANPNEAARLGRILVEEQLAACATLIPAVQSIYRWQGQVESSPKPSSCSKPPPINSPALEARLLQLHSYQTPEFLVLAVERQPALPSTGCRSSLRQPLTTAFSNRPVW